jgi:cobalt/nickel transport system permease protein
MHIPDGYLGPVTYGGLWAAMVPVWLVASRRVKEEVKAAQVPFLAMASSFSLLVMLFTVPLPGGTTGHITGSPLVAIFLGPWAGTLAVSVALAIQAILFGDGGITALGANCFNIAFAESFVAYGIYRMIFGMGSKLSQWRSPSNQGKTPAHLPFKIVGAGAGAYFAVTTGALLTALELGLQPVLHKGSGAASYFPFSFIVTLPAVLIPHLTAIGGLEVMITVAVLIFFQRIQPNMTKGLKPLLLIVLLVSLILPIASEAHEFRIERKGGEFTVVFGHGTHREEFDSSRIKQVKALDANGKSISVSPERKGEDVFLRVSEPAALVLVEIDNGYWSKTIYGWKNLPKRKASRVVEANRSLNYSKVLLSWSNAVQGPLEGVALDILLLKDPFQMKSGETLPVKILFQGKPLGKVEVLGNDHTKIGATDAEGTVSMNLSKGHQLITVTHKDPLKGDPDADYLSVTATLTFEVMK